MHADAEQLLKAVHELGDRLRRLSKEFDPQEFQRAMEDYYALTNELIRRIAEQSPDPDDPNG
jgi:hypothetical protein